ncbi:MAG: hypothetical protein QXQ46_11750 [Thermoplasmatales archaeon]
MTDIVWSEFASKIPRETRIAFEASGSAYSVSKRKNDRVDSIKIAKLRLVNMIPKAHLLDDEDRIIRDLLVQMRISNNLDM